MVGLVRFELTTSCTPCKRATRLRYSPMIHRKGEEARCLLPRQALFGPFFGPQKELRGWAILPDTGPEKVLQSTQTASI